MNSEDFWEQFEKLTFAFHIQKPEQRAKVYYEHLSTIDLDVFKRAVNDCIKESDRFPTIAHLLQTASKIAPKYGRQSVECEQCDGMGTISRFKHTFRARCIHGEQISKLMQLAPRDEADWSQTYFNLNKEWQKLYGEELEQGKVVLSTEHPTVSKAKEIFNVTKSITEKLSDFI